MTLLSVCQDAASLLGLRRPASIAGSANLTSTRFFALANQAGKELMRYHDWQSLTIAHTFVSLATQEQTGALDPDNFDRFLYNPEIWNRTTNQRLTGPTPQRYWQHLLNSGVSTGSVGFWRVIGGELHVLPVMTAGDTLSFEYIDRQFAASSLGVPQDKFEEDADVCRIVAATGQEIGEDLLLLELIWRFRHMIGSPQYAEDLKTCETEKEKAASRDRGTGRIRSPGMNNEHPPQPFWSGTVG